MDGTQGVLKDFPAWLERVAKDEGVILQSWQRQIAEAFADGGPVKVYGAPGPRAGKQWFHDHLRRYLNELDATALTP